MSLQEKYLETWYQTYAIEEYDCKGNEVVADTFWCKWMGQLTGSKQPTWEFSWKFFKIPIEKAAENSNEVVADKFWCKWMGQLTGSNISFGYLAAFLTRIHMFIVDCFFDRN